MDFGGTPNLRRELYRLADAYREHAHAPRVGKCSHVRHSKTVSLSRPEGGKAQLGGLIRCRSKACAVCLARRRADYADQVRRVAELWQSGWIGCVEREPKLDQATGLKIPRPPITELKGHPSTPAYLATFTIRHGWSDELAVTGHGVRDAWRALLQSRAWQLQRARFGFEYIVAEEVTHGRNGWHPHLHVLFLPARKLTTDEGLELAEWFGDQWAAMVAAHIGSQYEPLPDVGTDFRPCSAEDYISKTIGLELADPHNKRGRGGGRTPVQLLQSYADDDDEHALALYRHYETTMRGRRDLTWSKGLRDYRDVARAELARERQAEAEVAPLVAEIPGDIWDRWREQRQPHVRMLEVAERDGLDGVLWLLSRELGAWTADVVRQATERTLRCREVTGLDEAPKVGPPSCAGPLSSEALPDPADLLELCDFDAFDRF